MHGGAAIAEKSLPFMSNSIRVVFRRWPHMSSKGGGGEGGGGERGGMEGEKTGGVVGRARTRSENEWPSDWRLGKQKF